MPARGLGIPSRRTHAIICKIPTRGVGTVMQLSRLSWLVMHYITGLGTFVIHKGIITIVVFVPFVSVLVLTITFPFAAMTKVPTAHPRTAGGLIMTNMI